jgi:hypothetical protein
MIEISQAMIDAGAAVLCDVAGEASKEAQARAVFAAMLAAVPEPPGPVAAGADWPDISVSVAANALTAPSQAALRIYALGMMQVYALRFDRERQTGRPRGEAIR